MLVSCLYSTQARAGEVTVDFATTELADGSSLPNGTFSTTQTFAFNTEPGIQFAVNGGTYTGSTNSLKVNGMNKTLSISTTNGTKMTKIVFNEYTGATVTQLRVSSGTCDPKSTSALEWTNAEGSETVTFTIGGSRTSIQFTGVTITYDDGGGAPTPKLTVNKNKIDAGYMEIPYTSKIMLTGSNLTGNVTATSSDTNILTITPESCTKEEAEAGQEFEFTFTPTSETDAPTITFSSDGAEDIVVTSTAVDANFPTEKAECETITGLTQLGIGDEATYTGSDALVTYVYGNRIYVQDEGAAIRLTAAEGVDVSSIKIGDKLTNLDITMINTGWRLDSFDATSIASSDNEVVAKVVTPDQLADNLFRFVKVKYGMFETVGAPLNANAIGLDVLGTDIDVNVLDVDAFSGYVTEKGVCTVAGIYRYENIETKTPKILSPRTPADITVGYTTIPELTLNPTTVRINSGTQETALETSFAVTGTDISAPVKVSTETAGVTFPTAEFAADKFADEAEVPVTLSWIPSQVTEGTGLVKVATSFEYEGQTFTVEDNVNLEVLGAPNITADWDNWVIGGQMPAKKDIVISGENLMSGIRIECPEGITASPNSIAMSANKVEATTVTITVDVEESNFEKQVKLSTDGLAEPVAITIKGSNAKPLRKVTTLADVRAAEAEGTTVLYTGEAVVTYSDDENGFYMQDDTAGLYVAYLGNVLAAQGDKITSVLLSYGTIFGSTGWYFGTNASVPDKYIVVASGQTVEPAVVEADALATDGAQYADMLVKVNEIKLSTVSGDTFTAGSTYNGTTPAGKVSVSPFAGDIVGTDVPTEYVDVTGIYATLTGDSRALRPRVLTDITNSENQTPLVAFITKSATDYAASVHQAGTSVEMGEFACEFDNLPEGSHAIVTYEPAGAVIKLAKSGDDNTATENYALTDGTYTLALTATPAIGYYRDITVKFIFGSEATAENTREYTFEPLKVQDTMNPQATTLESDDFVAGEPGTFNLVQVSDNAVTTNLTVKLANCYDVVVVEKPVQHPYGITANTITLALGDEQGGEQPVAYAARAAQDDSDAQPLTLYPGMFGNATYNLTLTMNCTETPSATETAATPIEFNFVAQGDPNKIPLATLKVNYEYNTQVNIEAIEATPALYRVYTLQGTLLLDGASAKEVARLAPGLYIINGRKVSIRN